VASRFGFQMITDGLGFFFIALSGVHFQAIENGIIREPDIWRSHDPWYPTPGWWNPDETI
jgi:hypothetical protein